MLLPEMAAAPYEPTELQTVSVEFEGKSQALQIPSNPTIRLRQGLFLTADTDTRKLLFTQANLQAMTQSEDHQVQ